MDTTTTTTTTIARRPRRRGPALGLVAGLTLTLALAACGGDDGDTGDTGDPYGGDGATTTEASGGEAVAYEVSGIEYADVAAPAGGTVEIENTSGAAHTFTADDGAFDVAYGSGETATVPVPGEPGEYRFHCEIHPSMEATLTVE